ncbi:MAG: FG-GAP-like repeat-containing protein [Planctomycetota bacterium]|nr:FG-GAP-like repeat-containing protein [Planctomycetota bacterium]
MTPPPNTNGSRVFLPAAGNIDQRNFGFTPRGTTGQSENARIEGRVFTDSNQDGVQQPNEPGNAGVEIYLDLNANERRDFDEPRNVSDSLGNYSFSSLGSRSYTVRALLSEGNKLTSPVGNKFSSVEQVFSSSSTVLSKPQDVIVDDFDGRNGPDIAVALVSGNSIVIQLNDGQGVFSSTPITVNIAPNGKGPVAMASGNLNGPIAKDLVVANALNSTISVFLDFDGTGFKSSSLLTVDAMPTKIVLADIDSDLDLDIVLATQTTNATGVLKIYLNNGQGVFTPGASISSEGKRPMSMVIQDFNRDQVLDIAIANQGDFGRANDNGNVSVIFGLGKGGFASATNYLVGAGPLGIDASDLNGDGFQDLVVVNFSVNTASILRGSATGLFNVVAEQLSVGQGPVQVSLVDIDGDQDKDIIVSNLRSKSLSILRNRLSQERSENPTSMLFEPAESFGVAQISIGPRLVFATGDFNQSGTIDLALINSESNSLKILSNELIDGAHRTQLTGVGTTDKKNFGIRSEILKPSLDPFISPIELVEDAAPLTIPMTGIKRGRVIGPPLRVTSFSSNTAVIPHPSVAYTEGATTGQIAFAPSKDAQGQALLSVMVRDAGADGLFDTNDDGTIERTLLVSVKPVNDPPTIVLRGNQIITQGSNLRSVSNFATAFRPGGEIDEQSQSIAEFIVTNDRTDLFLSQPAIDNDGNLRYQPSLNQSGTAKIGVQVRDNGGTDSGGIDRSPLQFFQIFVTDLADGDIDFGDAPTATQSRLAASYPTQLKENGARHRTGQLVLGSLVDAEQDGQPTPGASGDDQKIDDEDGIRFAVTAMSSPILPTIASLVAIASASSKLDAWIDFNQDGDWSDSGEQILASASVTTGRNLIGFTIPAGSKTGMTYARFRLSSLGGLGVTGLAEDGEVEDYPFQILDTQITNTLTLFESELAQHELFVTGGSLVVRAQGKPVFSGPASNIERVLLVTSSGQSLYEILRPVANLFGTLQFVDSNTPIAISASEPNLNLAGYPTGSLYGIHTLDFSAAVPQVLQINATSIAAFNADKSVKIVLGAQDSIESSLGWALETRLLEQGKLVHVFKQSSSIVRIESSLPWQNPINRLDADGDGTVSPLDVLVIINHLNRSSGSIPNGNLPVFDPTNPAGQRFVDTNGSNTSEPLDVLVVINYLNQRDRAGEGELKANYPMSRSHRNGRDHSVNNAILEMVPELPEENAGSS